MSYCHKKISPSKMFFNKKSSKLISQYKGLKRKRSTTDVCNNKKKIRCHQFIQHCWSNNLDGVRNCLSRGVDDNKVLEVGRSIAIENNFPELLEMLLSHPDIKINNTTKAQCLMYACDLGTPAIVSRLLELPGLDINYQNEDGHTAAHWTSQAGQTEMLRILADTGRVDWNKTNKWGVTPLYVALFKGHSDIVDIIVQQPNIDYNVKTKKGVTLAQVAVKWGNVKCVETLAAQERCDCWNVPDSDGDTPIMWALKDDKAKIFKILLRCPRVDLSCRDEGGWSLVFRAIQMNKLGEKC